MANLSKIRTLKGIHEAMAEYDAIGQNAFLAKYGYGDAIRYLLKDGNKRYDSKAILDVAYGFDNPSEGPLPNTAFSGGGRTVAKYLVRKGFTVVERLPDGTEFL